MKPETDHAGYCCNCNQYSAVQFLGLRYFNLLIYVLEIDYATAKGLHCTVVLCTVLCCFCLNLGFAKYSTVQYHNFTGLKIIFNFFC